MLRSPGVPRSESSSPIRRPSHATRGLCLGALLILLGAASPAGAASVYGAPNTTQIHIGETSVIELYLDLDPGEEASTFEGGFTLRGSGGAVETLTAADLSAGGPTWSSVFGGLVGSEVAVSLTSTNTGGDRLVATLTVTGRAAGNLDVELAWSSATWDLDAPPWSQETPITTATGATVARVTVLADPIQVPSIGPWGLAVLAAALLSSPVLIARLRRRPRPSADAESSSS